MKKILIVITTGVSPYGGLMTVIMNYMKHMDMNGLQIDIVSRNNPEQSIVDELYELGIIYYQISYRTSNPFMYVYRLSRLARRYDVVHVNSNSATASIELFSAKVAGVEERIVHNHSSKTSHPLLNRILKPVFKRLYTKAIACSEMAGNWLFGENNFQVLNNGIDCQRFRFNYGFRTVIRNQYGITEEDILLGHVGKIYEPKNHQFIIEIFKEYHKTHFNAKLILVGDGEMRGAIEELVKKYKLEAYVIFTGMRSDVEMYLSAIDIFVFPSIWEGMPLSMIEAQASGLYCIASKNIDEKVNVTEKVKMLSIDIGVEPWVSAINEYEVLDRVKESYENAERIKRAGYDSATNADALRKIYSGNV